MTRDNLQLLRDGQPDVSSPLLQLRAGDLSMAFDPATVSLRYVRLGTTEILRGVYAAVRDRDWNTVPSRISNLASIVSDRSFRLTFDVECRLASVDFTWQGSLVGSEAGMVRFDLDGEARSSFEQNRIGFCVLHPSSGCAGQPCGIEHADGSRDEGAFPALIAPDSLFRSVRALAHEVEPGIVAEVRFEGQTFETEDQRNWTDASYKTFCPPLAETRPVVIAAGARIQQAVELRVYRHPEAPGVTIPPATPMVVVDVPQGLDLGSRVGTGFIAASRPLRSEEIELLRVLRPDHLRVDLSTSRSGWERDLAEAGRQADALGATLHVATVVGDDPERELRIVADAVEREAAPVSLFLVFDEGHPATSPASVSKARAVLTSRWPDVPLAAGAAGNFVDINRNRPPGGGTSLPCYSITPECHGTDNLTIVETLEAQADTVETAASFSDQQVVVSPLTLRSRTEAPDPRQKTLFGAAWTLASLGRLAGLAAVHRLTYYETVGAGGVLEGDLVHPLYHVLCDVAECVRFSGIPSPVPLRLAAAVGEVQSGQRRVFLANLTNGVLVVRLRVEALSARARVLDELTGDLAIRKPGAFRADPGIRLGAEGGAFALSLRPWATARIDLG